MKIFTIYDNLSGTYLTPFFSMNDDTAARDFASAVNDPNHAFHRSSEDFALFCIGVFDDTTGEITTEPGSIVAKAHELKLRETLKAIPHG